MSETFTDHLPVADPGRGVGRAVWARRACMTLLAVLPVAALIGLIGQHESSSTVMAPAATLRLKAPKIVRGGLFYQARVEVVAHADLKFPSLVVDSGWMEGMQFNSVTPQAPNENALNGKVQFGYGALPAGQRLTVWFEFQVNPTNDGEHPYGIQLLNGNRPVASIHRTIRILP